MTVRIHTESSEEACSRGGSKKKVQHSNNKMEGPSCVINHWNKQRAVHGSARRLKLNHDHWKKLQVETQRSVWRRAIAASWAVKRSSLIEIEDERRCLPPDGHAACLRPLRRDAGSIDCEMAGDQIYSIIPLEERSLPSHAHSFYPSLPTW